MAKTLTSEQVGLSSHQPMARVHMLELETPVANEQVFVSDMPVISDVPTAGTTYIQALAAPPQIDRSISHLPSENTLQLPTGRIRLTNSVQDGITVWDRLSEGGTSPIEGMFITYYVLLVPATVKQGSGLIDVRDYDAGVTYIARMNVTRVPSVTESEIVLEVAKRAPNFNAGWSHSYGWPRIATSQADRYASGGSYTPVGTATTDWEDAGLSDQAAGIHLPFHYGRTTRQPVQLELGGRLHRTRGTLGVKTITLEEPDDYKPDLFVSDGDDVPTAGYALVDSEIIGWSSKTTEGALVIDERGAFGSGEQEHVPNGPFYTLPPEVRGVITYKGNPDKLYFQSAETGDLVEADTFFWTHRNATTQESENLSPFGVAGGTSGDGVPYVAFVLTRPQAAIAFRTLLATGVLKAPELVLVKNETNEFNPALSAAVDVAGEIPQVFPSNRAEYGGTWSGVSDGMTLGTSVIWSSSAISANRLTSEDTECIEWEIDMTEIWGAGALSSQTTKNIFELRLLLELEGRTKAALYGVPFGDVVADMVVRTYWKPNVAGLVDQFHDDEELSDRPGWYAARAAAVGASGGYSVVARSIHDDVTPTWSAWKPSTLDLSLVRGISATFNDIDSLLIRLQPFGRTRSLSALLGWNQTLRQAANEFECRFVSGAAVLLEMSDTDSAEPVIPAAAPSQSGFKAVPSMRFFADVLGQRGSDYTDPDGSLNLIDANTSTAGISTTNCTVAIDGSNVQITGTVTNKASVISRTITSADYTGDVFRLQLDAKDAGEETVTPYSGNPIVLTLSDSSGNEQWIGCDVAELMRQRELAFANQRVHFYPGRDVMREDSGFDISDVTGWGLRVNWSVTASGGYPLLKIGNFHHRTSTELFDDLGVIENPADVLKSWLYHGGVSPPGGGGSNWLGEIDSTSFGAVRTTYDTNGWKLACEMSQLGDDWEASAAAVCRDSVLQVVPREDATSTKWVALAPSTTGTWPTQVRDLTEVFDFESRGRHLDAIAKNWVALYGKRADLDLRDDRDYGSVTPSDQANALDRTIYTGFEAVRLNAIRDDGTAQEFIDLWVAVHEGAGNLYAFTVRDHEGYDLEPGDTVRFPHPLLAGNPLTKVRILNATNSDRAGIIIEAVEVS